DRGSELRVQGVAAGRLSSLRAMKPANDPAATSDLGHASVESESSAPLVGAQLREKRFEMGMSLRELARRLDVSPSLVSQIETGKIQPSVRTLYAMVSELGISLDDVFHADGARAPEAESAVQVNRGRGSSAGTLMPT